MSRDELIERIEEIAIWPEIRSGLDNYINQYVHVKDKEMVKHLLEAGADPNPKEDLDCYLHHLFHEYKASKTTAGDRILELLKVLLEAGADPNRVWCNNWRAYDYAATEGVEPVSRLLEKYGADRAIREYI